MLKRSKQTIYFTLGWIFFALGMIGVFLPVLPTTPFMIVAAYFFSSSSEKWHKWLLERPVVGEIMREWNQNGVISLRAKFLATAMILASFGLLFWRGNLAGLRALIAFVPICVLAFIWSRPSRPQK